MRYRKLVGIHALLITIAVGQAAHSQTDATESTSAPAAEASDDTADGTAVDKEEVAARHAAFKERMTGTSLVGSFTTIKGDDKGIDRDKPLKEERYDITLVKKADLGDYWFITARIRYGKHDVKVPVPVEVKWAGDTPMIILNKVPVPGLGTFDARVLINGNRYAGTWQHDNVGGHLFGRLERTEEEEAGRTENAEGTE